MKQTKTMMGMTITVEIVDAQVKQSDIDRVYDYFTYIDEKFSPFKPTSELMKINRGEISATEYSPDMQEILKLAEQTKKETNGFFDVINRRGALNPSGIVKGWAIHQAVQILWRSGLNNFYIDAGGDIQVSGHAPAKLSSPFNGVPNHSEDVSLGHDKDNKREPWTVGIRNPFKPETEIVKVLELKNNEGVATSGTYARGQHIYNPFEKNKTLDAIISVTVIGPNVYEADRFATAVLAMGPAGIAFLENLPGFEGYAIDQKGIATMTSGFEKYVKTN